MHEEEAVAEVDRDQRERGRHERNAEPVHLAEQRSGEATAEPVPVHDHQTGGDDERARDAAEDDAERALLPDDDEQDRGADRDRDVRQAGDHERGRALLGPEHRRLLLVDHLREHPERRRAHQVGVVEAEPVRHLRREHEPEHETEQAHAECEPEARAHDEAPLALVLAVEVEAEERGSR